MNYIEADWESICMGELVTHAQVCSSALVQAKAGFLAEAAGALGSPQNGWEIEGHGKAGLRR